MFTELNLAEILNLISIKHTYELIVSKKKDREKIINKIEKIVAKHGIIRVNDEYARAIGNATKYGSCPILCSIYIGSHKQMICVIADSGKGFDYKQIVKKYESGQVYYHNHGKGTKYFAVNKHLQVDWQNEGRTIILYYNGKHKHGHN